MPDFDANEDLARLPDTGPGDPPDPAHVQGLGLGGLALAAPVIPRVSPSPPSASTITSRPASGVHTIAADRPSRGSSLTAGADAAPERRSPAILRYLDVLIVVIAAIAVVALGAPALGYAIGAGAWLLQRVLAHADRRWIRNAAEPRTQLGLTLFEAFGRIWLLAGAIVAAGVLGGRADGLTAALTIFGAYSVAFAVRVITGPPTGAPRRRAVR